MGGRSIKCPILLSKMLKEIKDFYERTKITHKGEPVLDEEQWPLNWIKIFYKTFPRFPKIPLIKFNIEEELEMLLQRRQSFREFSGTPLKLSQLEHLLYYSMGIKPGKEHSEQPTRMQPSGGARYPIETYVVVNNVGDLKQGLYHYNVKDSLLEVMLTEDLRDKMRLITGELMGGTSAAVIILTGVMSRAEVKYGINAYKFALLEAGHIGQNIYLLTEKNNLGCCPMAGFDNDKTATLLDLVEDEIPLYMFALGNK